MRRITSRCSIRNYVKTVKFARFYLERATGLGTSFIDAQDAQIEIQKEIEMRELTLNEMSLVSGAGDDCSSGGGNEYGGISDTTSVGDEIINIYEGVVAAVSHIIERVANAF